MSNASSPKASNMSATALISQLQDDINDLLVTGQVSSEIFKDITVDGNEGPAAILSGLEEQPGGLPNSAMVGAALISENAFLQKEARERNNLIEELKSKVDLLSTILIENVAKATAMENDVIKKQEELCAFEEREILLQTDNAKLTQTVKEQEAELQEARTFQDQLISSETTISSLQDELVAALENLLKSQQEVKEFAEVDNLRVIELDSHSKQIEKLSNELNTNRIELSAAKNESLSIRRECEESLAMNEKIVRDLRSTLEFYKLENAKAKENVARARGAHEKWEEERNELIASMEAWKKMSAGASTPQKGSSSSSSSGLKRTGSGLPVRARGASNPSTPVSTPRPTSSKGNGNAPSEDIEMVVDTRHYVSIDADYSMLSGLAPTTLRPSELLMDAARKTYLAVAEIIESGDIEKMKSELMSLARHLEDLRSSNARLLHKLQAARGNIQVCCRTRPPSVTELAALQGDSHGKICVDVIDDNELAVYDYRSEIWRSFNFDRVWRMDATQSEVFADIEPLVMSVIEGYNCCLLAYGQTGSGKTFTMNGYGDEFGISYRTLHRLFEALETKRENARAQAIQIKSRALSMQHHKDRLDGDDKISASRPSLTEEEKQLATAEMQLDTFSYKVEVSIMEIYNDHVRDLLVNPGIDGFSPSLEIRQTPDGSVFVPGLLQVRVFSLDDVMMVFARGSSNRATAATNLNERSSRSHLILQVSVTTIVNDESVVKAKLSLVDLAGSERVSKSGSMGSAMKEAQYINKSLSALGDVMEALDQKQKHIPYRNSKLTYLLNDSLGGNSKTMMVVTLCPTALTSEETIFSLQFASRVRHVSLGAARKNVSAKNLEDALKAVKTDLREALIKNGGLEESVANLKRELRIRNEKSHGTVQLDTKLKTIDEAKKYAETQFQQLSKQNRELMQRLQEERTEKSQSTLELSAAKRDLHKLRDRVKEMMNEKEAMLKDLRAKDHELAHLKLRRVSGAGFTEGNRSNSPERDPNITIRLNDSGSGIGTEKQLSPKSKQKRIAAYEEALHAEDAHGHAPTYSALAENLSSVCVADLIERYESKSTLSSTASMTPDVVAGKAFSFGDSIVEDSAEKEPKEILNIDNIHIDDNKDSTSEANSLPLESFTHPTLQPSSPVVSTVTGYNSSSFNTPTTANTSFYEKFSDVHQCSELDALIDQSSYNSYSHGNSSYRAGRHSGPAGYVSSSTPNGYHMENEQQPSQSQPTRPASTTNGLVCTPASSHYKPKMSPRSKEALLKHQERLAKKRLSL